MLICLRGIGGVSFVAARTYDFDDEEKEKERNNTHYYLGFVSGSAVGYPRISKSSRYNRSAAAAVLSS